MESVIKKIFSDKVDEVVHSEFVKFGKGTFDNRYLVECKKQKDKWSIKTGAEFANFLVRYCLEKINGEVQVTGVIVATFDLKDLKIKIEGVKQFMGIKQAKINTTVSSKELIEIMNKFPKAFFALSLSTERYFLKIKPKAPKSAKPSAKGEKVPAADFCSLKTSDQELIKELFFDSRNFEEASISHSLIITQITPPKGESDPVKIREMAKRKGKIVRKLIIDGKAETSEKEFLA